MMKKLMHNTVAAAGFAALLLVGACASSDNDGLNETGNVVEIRPEASGQEATVAPAPGPALVDSDGNVYSSSAAPGRGNPSTVGTNTNVNIIPERSTVSVTEQAIVTETPVTTVETTTVETTPVITETTVTETTTTVPMTSAAQETTTTTEETPAPTRTRMRKD